MYFFDWSSGQGKYVTSSRTHVNHATPLHLLHLTTYMFKRDMCRHVSKSISEDRHAISHFLASFVVLFPSSPIFAIYIIRLRVCVVHQQYYLTQTYIVEYDT